MAAAAVPEMHVSLALYLGGLAVTLSGVQAVCASMGTGEITVVATVLAVMGFAFSLACRYLKVEPRVIEVVCAGLIVYIVYSLIGDQHRVFGQDLNWYVQGADRTEERLAAGLMWSAVFWSWTLVSSESVMFSCVLTTAMIGLTGSVNLNNSTLFWFCIFVVSMIFLLIHQNYLQNRVLAAQGQKKEIPWQAPAAQALRVQASLATLCAMLVLCIGLVVVVPMQAAFSGLSLGRALGHLVGANRLSEEDLPLSASRFSDDMALEIGRGSIWPTSSDTVMHVETSDNLPHYWRGRTYDLYTGMGWQSTQRTPSPLAGIETDRGPRYDIPPGWIAGEGQHGGGELADRTHIRITVDVQGTTGQFYYADEPRSLQFDAHDSPEPSLASDGSLDLGGHLVQATYVMDCAPPLDASVPSVQTLLRQTGTNYPQTVSRLYLSSRNNVRSYSGPRRNFQNRNRITTEADKAYYRQAVQQALQSLPPGRRTPLDKALAIQQWITSQCTYSLSVDPLPADVDHVHAFLAQTRRGYCDMFASAMVVLCRTAGIPARLATGFAPGEPDDTGFNVRSLDKHAWAEVFFSGSGWLIFDPTVGSHTDGSVPTGTTSGGFWTQFRQGLTENGPLPMVLLAAILVCVGIVAKKELYDRWRARRRKTLPPPVAPADRARTELGRQYARMTRALARIGLARRVSETPAEYEARVLPFLAREEVVLGVPVPAGAVSALTTQFTLARYGGVAGSRGAEAAQLANQVAATASRVRWARWRLRLRGRRPV